jgi:CHAT domain-containing protein/tetratricopeptide (TPR) repeat protein
MNWRALHITRTFRAGRAAALTRLALALLCAFTVFTLPTFLPSQAQSPEQGDGDDELVAALLKAGKEGQSVDMLLDERRALITPRLWEKLAKQALSAYYNDGPDQSFTLYGITLNVAERLKDQRLIAITHYRIGRTHSGLGQTREAIRSHLTSKSFFEAAGLRRDLIYVLGDLAALHYQAEEYKTARSYAEESIALAEKLKGGNELRGVWPDEYGVAGALSILGALSRREGDYGQAVEHLQKSIALYQQLNGETLKFGFYLADNLTELGRVYSAMGDNVQAFSCLSRALDIAKKLPQRDMLANALNSAGVLYLEQEDYEKASDYLRQSLQIYQELKNQTESARVLLNLGVSDQRRSNFDQALESFRNSLYQAEAASDKDLMTAAGQGLGVVYREKKDYSAALEVLDRSLSLAREVGDQTRTAEILWRKAEVKYETGSLAESAALSEEAHQITRRLRLPKLSYLTATALGKAYLGQKKIDPAFQTLSQAIEQVEAMRDHVIGQELERQLFFENKVSAYHLLIDLLVAQNRPNDALVYAERAKGRVLLDVMSKGKAQITDALTREEREEEQKLNLKIVALNNELREERLKPVTDDAKVSRLSEQLDAARLQYASFQNAIQAAHPELRMKSGRLQLLSKDHLNDLAPGNRTAFLEYVVTKDKAHLFLIAKPTRGRVVVLKVITVNVSEMKLATLVNEFRRSITGRHPVFSAFARELYDLLIKPAEPHLRGVTALRIIPDGILWDVPFQALQAANGRYLLEDYAVSYAPSLSVLREIKRSNEARSKPSLLAFGNPMAGTETVKQLQEVRRGEGFKPLPEAENEVASVARIYGADRSRVFVGREAEERQFKLLASNYGAIHFATHGVLDNRQPLYSYLLLANSGDNDKEDGLLEAREIMNLNLRADLVVLSACETARGRIGAGEGVIGMSWAFFVAGCRTTVVSQWEVDSAGTAELMVGFFQRLKGAAGKYETAKSNALRLAALKLMKNPRYQHPYYWAGFVVVGNDR